MHRIKPPLLGLITASLLLLNSACATQASYEHSNISMVNFADPKPKPEKQAQRLIFLPSSGQTAEDFATEGFVSSTQQQHPRVGLMAVNTHDDHYLANTVAERLHLGVLKPLSEKENSHLWLIGIGQGALGALLYSKDYRGDVKGIVLISPYLGGDEILASIKNRGGPAAWFQAEQQAAEQNEQDTDFVTQSWRWLVENQNRGKAGVPVYLLYAENGKATASQQLLASLLPSQRSRGEPGTDDWLAWRGLWSGFLLRQNRLTRAAKRN